MANKITYDDKISLTTSALPRANKCTDDDLNEIKQVVNDNADELDENTTNIEELETNIIDLENKFNFSLQEQVIGTWIDGKPIYRKVFSNITIPNDTASNIPHGISNFDQLIDLKAKWYDTVDNHWRVNPRYSSSGSNTSIAFMCNNTNLIVQGIGTNWSTRTNNCTVVLEYTKTTN